MKQLYYTDPLAAAWMAKHHGMHFHVEGIARGIAFNEFDLDMRPSKFSVHPDSLHLLEPRIGDILWMEVQHPSQMGVCRWPTTLEHDFESYIEAIEGEYLAHRIINRIGKAFHWPEKAA